MKLEIKNIQILSYNRTQNNLKINVRSEIIKIEDFTQKPHFRLNREFVE